MCRLSPSRGRGAAFQPSFSAHEESTAAGCLQDHMMLHSKICPLCSHLAAAVMWFAASFHNGTPPSFLTGPGGRAAVGASELFSVSRICRWQGGSVERVRTASLVFRRSWNKLDRKCGCVWSHDLTWSCCGAAPIVSAESIAPDEQSLHGWRRWRRGGRASYSSHFSPRGDKQAAVK